jgi:hypothetical protein
MDVIFTYLPVRLKEITEIYLKYTIFNLNKTGVIPTIYSDKNYFLNTKLDYKWEPFDIDNRFKINTLWSYPKLKVLSLINKPFIHLDNDLIIEDFDKLIKLIKSEQLNVCYKRKIDENQVETFTEIFKKYLNDDTQINELNNTSIIATEQFTKINCAYLDVINVIDDNYDFFTKRYNDVPPITLNQQYVNTYFNEVNYLFNENPSYDDLNENGLCHMAEKTITGRFLIKKTLI